MEQVWPITNFFDQQVNMGSKRLVDEHSNKWPAKRILLQVRLQSAAGLGSEGKMVRAKKYLKGKKERGPRMKF